MSARRLSVLFWAFVAIALVVYERRRPGQKSLGLIGATGICLLVWWGAR